MKKKTIFQTVISRFLILFFNFGLIIFSSNIWGSHGKGLISLVTADLAIISFFSNIFVAGSVSYFLTKYPKEQVLFFAYGWAVLVGIGIVLFFGAVPHTAEVLPFLIALSVLLSLYNANISFFIGSQDIRKFNIFSVLQLAIHLFFIVLLVFVLGFSDIEMYFVAQIACYFLLFMISSFYLFKNFERTRISFSKSLAGKMFSYGWKTQLSAFVQFLNYRLSFYFLEFFKGFSSVGIFSVGVAISEAVWTISRSLSVILYSNVLNTNDVQLAINKTKISVRISFLITVLFLFVLLLIPASGYIFFFGEDFHQTKSIILLLSPGILAMSVSNIIGHYFAAVNKLKILNIKSIAGLFFTILLSWYCIPRWGILGACFATTVSYCISSALLFWKFYQITEFRYRDFILSKSELRIFLEKVKSGSLFS